MILTFLFLIISICSFVIPLSVMTWSISVISHTFAKPVTLNLDESVSRITLSAAFTIACFMGTSSIFTFEITPSGWMASVPRKVLSTRKPRMKSVTWVPSRVNTFSRAIPPVQINLIFGLVANFNSNVKVVCNHGQAFPLMQK